MMKRRISVLALTVRSSLAPALVILLAMAAAEFGLFRMALGASQAEVDAALARRQAEIDHFASMGVEAYYDAPILAEPLEYLVDQSHIVWVLAAAFLLLTAQLSRVGCDAGGKLGYTLRRLPIAEKTCFLWQGAGNTLFFLLLWGVQVLTALGLGACYLHAVPAEAVNRQTLFLAFSRSDFLHTLLPMGDWLCLAATLALAVCLGLCTAAFSFWQRRGCFGGELLGAAAAALFWFRRGVGSLNDNAGLLIAVALLTLSAAVRIYQRKEVEEHESEAPAEEAPQT